MIEKKDMKKNLETVLSEYGFKYVKKGYYCDNEELITIINIQKSSYDNSYYVNFGFLIKKENPDISYPQTNVCDVFGRFNFKKENTIYHSVDIEKFDIAFFEECIRENVEKMIVPVMEAGLQKYFDMFPQRVATATLKAKKYLHIEG